jgi:hypothetical protein
MNATAKKTKKGIVSELRTALLISSENKFLSYPCRVIVHIMERGTDGSILLCTVSDGGAFVEARRAKFENMSEVLVDRYQSMPPAQLAAIYINPSTMTMFEFCRIANARLEKLAGFQYKQNDGGFGQAHSAIKEVLNEVALPGMEVCTWDIAVANKNRVDLRVFRYEITDKEDKRYSHRQQGKIVSVKLLPMDGFYDHSLGSYIQLKQPGETTTIQQFADQIEGIILAKNISNYRQFIVGAKESINEYQGYINESVARLSEIKGIAKPGEPEVDHPTKEQVILVLQWLRTSGVKMNDKIGSKEKWQDHTGNQFTNEEVAGFYFNDLSVRNFATTWYNKESGSVRRGDRVERTGEERKSGKVLEVNDTEALVQWDEFVMIAGKKFSITWTNFKNIRTIPKTS